MPTYTFLNTQTGEEFDLRMSIAEMLDYKEKFPHIQQVIGAPKLVDPVRLGVRKADDGFKEVLQKIHEKTPGSDLKKMGKI